MDVFKLLFSFLLSVFLSNKDEGNFKSFKFNPVKIIAVMLFYMSILLNLVLIAKFVKLSAMLVVHCPAFKY